MPHRKTQVISVLQFLMTVFEPLHKFEYK